MSAATEKPASRLTSTQRKYLRGVAHPLSPVVHVGKAGINDGVLAATRRALDDHELIKVKIPAERVERAAMAAELVAGCDADLAGAVGRIAILYRANPDPEKRRIVLPAAGAASSAPADGDEED